MKEKLSTTGMGTHSPHSFWNGKLATKFNVEVFFWIVWHSFFVFVFAAERPKGASSNIIRI